MRRRRAPWYFGPVHGKSSPNDLQGTSLSLSIGRCKAVDRHNQHGDEAARRGLKVEEASCTWSFHSFQYKLNRLKRQGAYKCHSANLLHRFAQRSMPALLLGGDIRLRNAPNVRLKLPRNVAMCRKAWPLLMARSVGIAGKDLDQKHGDDRCKHLPGMAEDLQFSIPTGTLLLMSFILGPQLVQARNAEFLLPLGVWATSLFLSVATSVLLLREGSVAATTSPSELEVHRALGLGFSRHGPAKNCEALRTSPGFLMLARSVALYFWRVFLPSTATRRLWFHTFQRNCLERLCSSKFR